MYQLPIEIISEILINNSYEDLASIRRVNRTLNKIYQEPLFWLLKAQKEFDVTLDQFYLAPFVGWKSLLDPHLKARYHYLSLLSREQVTFGSEKIKTISLCLKRAIKIRHNKLINYFINLGGDNFGIVIDQAVKIGDENLYHYLKIVYQQERDKLISISQRDGYPGLTDHLINFSPDNNYGYLPSAIKGGNPNLINLFLDQLLLYIDENPWELTEDYLIPNFLDRTLAIAIEYNQPLVIDKLLKYIDNPTDIYLYHDGRNNNCRDLSTLSDKEKFVLLRGAIKNGHIDLINTIIDTGLLERTDDFFDIIFHPNTKLSALFSLLNEAIVGKQIESFNLILSLCDSMNLNSLLSIAVSTNIKFVNLLLSSIDKVNIDHITISRAIKKGNWDIILLLMKYYTDEHIKLSLNYCCIHGHKDLLLLFMDFIQTHNLNINYQLTPTNLGIDYDLLMILIDHGFKITETENRTFIINKFKTSIYLWQTLKNKANH